MNEVREITEKWLSEYNCERPHESLRNMTPEEYRQHHYLTGILKMQETKAGLFTGALVAVQ
ncbi:transposase B [Escherichia coli M605]|uniref:Transposase B n=1 Tax=Escherichia coli M605 TaxID=656417 RepID=F4SY64_ECOLX|nr:transposase B [Escherichia coli M605]